MQTLLLLVVGVIGIYWLASFTLNYLRRKAIQKSLMAAAEDMGLLATTPEQIFEHNLRVLQRSDPKQAAEYLHQWIMRAIIEGREPRKEDLIRFQGLGRLKIVDKDGLQLYPDATYEIDGVVRGRVFFRKDLALVGYKDYQSDVEAILIRTMEQKHLLPADAEFLRRIHCLFESTKWGEHYGGPGFPYPDERFHIREKVRGEPLDLYFNENFALIVVMKRQSEQRDEVLWELPGARQPELYQRA